MAAEQGYLIPGCFSWVSLADVSLSLQQQHGLSACLTEIEGMFLDGQSQLKACRKRVRDHFHYS